MDSPLVCQFLEPVWEWVLEGVVLLLVVLLHQVVPILGILLPVVLLQETLQLGVLLQGSLHLVVMVLLQIGCFDLIKTGELVDLYLVDPVDLAMWLCTGLHHLLLSYALLPG